MGCWNDVIAGKYGKARSRRAIGRKPRTTSKVRDGKREVGPSQAEIGMAGGGDGKREAGSGKREAGSGKREVGSRKRRAEPSRNRNGGRRGREPGSEKREEDLAPMSKKPSSRGTRERSAEYETKHVITSPLVWKLKI